MASNPTVLKSDTASVGMRGGFSTQTETASENKRVTQNAAPKPHLRSHTDIQLSKAVYNQTLWR